MRTEYADTNSPVGGMLEAAGRAGVEVMPTAHVYAESAGVIPGPLYRSLADLIVADVRARAPFDGLALDLHGAALAAGVETVETDLLRRLRAVAGRGCVIGATLDLHANLTQSVVDAADVLVPYHEYPHVDQAARGGQLLGLIAAIKAGRVRAVMHLERLPMLLADAMATNEPGTLGHAMLAACREACAEDVLHAAFLHGFPWSDQPRAGAAVLVVADRNERTARSVAIRLAEHAWLERERARPRMLRPVAAVERVLARPGPVVIGDFSDNPGGGAPGDGTHLLRALIEREVEGAAIGCIWDPVTAELAHAAGEGSEPEVAVGGRASDLSGSPVAGRAVVERLSDGRFRNAGGMRSGVEVEGGPSALIRIGGAQVVVATKRFQTLDPEPFRLHGVDAGTRRVVVVKSANHFRAGFASVASDLWAVAAPGPVTPYLDELPWTARPWPVWPLDADVETRFGG